MLLVCLLVVVLGVTGWFVYSNQHAKQSSTSRSTAPGIATVQYSASLSGTGVTCTGDGGSYAGYVYTTSWYSLCVPDGWPFAAPSAADYADLPANEGNHTGWLKFAGLNYTPGAKPVVTELSSDAIPQGSDLLDVGYAAVGAAQELRDYSGTVKSKGVFASTGMSYVEYRSAGGGGTGIDSVPADVEQDVYFLTKTSGDAYTEVTYAQYPGAADETPMVRLLASTIKF